MSKHELTVVPQEEISEADALRDATFASLEGQACSEGSQALAEAVNEQVLHHRSITENEFSARRQLGRAVSQRGLGG